MAGKKDKATVKVYDPESGELIRKFQIKPHRERGLTRKQLDDLTSRRTIAGALIAGTLVFWIIRAVNIKTQEIPE